MNDTAALYSSRLTKIPIQLTSQVCSALRNYSELELLCFSYWDIDPYSITIGQTAQPVIPLRILIFLVGLDSSVKFYVLVFCV